jgi:hypothetical protein
MKDTGGPAFPTDHNKNVAEGMTLRDYFAAKAMQGDWATGSAGAGGDGFVSDARRYYKMADAMLAERNKP